MGSCPTCPRPSDRSLRPGGRAAGPVGRVALVGDSVAEHLLAVLREALTNVVRHARATTVEVAVTVTGGELEATVTDDGVGCGPRRPGGYGLDDLARRAGALAGHLDVGAGPDGGCRVAWCVPLGG